MGPTKIARWGGPVSWIRWAAFALLVILCWAIAALAFAAYAFLPPGARAHPEMAAIFAQHRLGIYTHIFASLVTLLVGPFQFLEGFRRQWPWVHRMFGWWYTAGVGVGGLAGLYMATIAFGGWTARTGFFALGVCWLATLVVALRAILRRDFVLHRQWMIRNFALTLAAVTLRLQLLVSFLVLKVDFEVSYPIISWVCWVPNLLIAEVWIRVMSRPQA